MAVRLGKDFRVSIKLAGVWHLLPGERSSGLKITNEQSDSSSKAGPWRELTACGTRASEAFATGVMRDDDSRSVWNAVCESAISGATLTVRVASTGTAVVEGDFKVTSISRTGDYNGHEMFEVGFSSSGKVNDGIDKFAILSEGDIPVLAENDIMVLQEH